jgi:hypothetical protein
MVGLHREISKRGTKWASLPGFTTAAMFSLWLAPTIRYRLETGVVSFASLELIALLAIGLLLASKIQAMQADPILRGHPQSC